MLPLVCCLLFVPASMISGSVELPFAGTWDGQDNGLPAVELTLRNDNGRISGEIGFYFQTREEGGKWRLGEKTPYTVPLLSPRLEGAVLTFETIHHKQHGSLELGPNNKYRVRFIGATEARLNIISGPGKVDDTQGLRLTLRKPEPPKSAVDRAREAVGWLLAGEYAKLYDASTPHLKELASVDSWKMKAGPVTASLGKLIEFGEPKSEAVTGGIGVALPAKFEKGDFEFNVIVDDAGLIGSLFVRPATPKSSYTNPAYSRPDSYTERELTVGNDEWKLPATLTLPKGAVKLAAVVLVHGSGAHDRDETVFANKPFRDLAEGLASQGVAVLRYEKRNKVHQAKLLTLPRFTPREETIEDAGRAAALLQTIPEIDSKRIFVLGHSLGGYLLPLILQQAPNVAGGIVLAGTTRPLEDVMAEQYDYLVPLQTAGSDDLKKQGERALADVRAGAAEVKALTPANQSGPPILGIPRSYWLAVKGYNPPALAAKSPARLLILQGERDYQVTMTDFANWKAALGTRKDVVFKSYPSLNHLFEDGVGKSRPEEYAKAGHVSAEVIEDIAHWVLKH